jgi:hypothetical protein
MLIWDGCKASSTSANLAWKENRAPFRILTSPNWHMGKIKIYTLL